MPDFGFVPFTPNPTLILETSTSKALCNTCGGSLAQCSHGTASRVRIPGLYVWGTLNPNDDALRSLARYFQEEGQSPISDTVQFSIPIGALPVLGSSPGSGIRKLECGGQHIHALTEGGVLYTAGVIRGLSDSEVPVILLLNLCS